MKTHETRGLPAVLSTITKKGVGTERRTGPQGRSLVARLPAFIFQVLLSFLLIVAMLPLPASAWATSESDARGGGTAASGLEEFLATEAQELEDFGYSEATRFTSFDLGSGEETTLMVSDELPLSASKNADGTAADPPKIGAIGESAENSLISGTLYDGSATALQSLFNNNRIPVPTSLLNTHPYVCIGIIESTFHNEATDEAKVICATGWIFADYAVMTSAHAIYDQEYGKADSIVFSPIYRENSSGEAISDSYDAIDAIVPSSYTDSYSRYYDYAIVVFEEDLGDLYGYFGFRTYSSLSTYNNMQAWLTGYPAPYDSVTNPDGIGDGKTMYTAGGQIYAALNPIMYTMIDASAGQDGAPVWVPGDPNNNGYALGLHRSDTLYGASTLNLAVRIDTSLYNLMHQYRSWTPSQPDVPREQEVTYDDEYYADPVNLATGAQKIELSYLDQSAQMPFSLDLKYEGDKLVLGEMGTGWYHNYEQKVVEIDEETYHYYTSPSTFIVFELDDETEQYTGKNPTQKEWILTPDPSGTCEINCADDKRLFFDEAGRLIRTENRTGDALDITYSSTSTTIEDPSTGRSLVLTKNSRGLIIGAQTRFDNVTSASMAFSYSMSRRLAGITDPNEKQASYTYNGDGRIVSGTDGDVITYFTNTYDALGRIAAQTDGENNTTYFSYDPDYSGEAGTEDLSLTEVTDRLDNTATYVFDDKNHLIKKTDQDGNSTTYTYDAFENKVSETDGSGNVTTWTYDANGRVLTKTDALNNQTIYTYDSRGNMTSLTAPDGAVTSNVFNAANQLVSTTDAADTQTTFTYLSETGSRVIERFAADRSLLTAYEDGFVSEETDGEGNTTYYTRDAMGRVTEVIDANEDTTSYTYDTFGRLLAKEDGSGAVVAYTYDARGNILTVTDPLDKVTTYTYDANGKLTSATDPENGTTSYTYDAEGRLIEEEDPEGRIISRAYSGAGLLTKITDGLGNETLYVYDAAGNLVSMTTPEGNEELYVYDVAGHMTSKTDAIGNETTYTYDECGRVGSVTDALDNTTVMEYDARGNLVSVTDALEGETLYTYDAFGNLTSATYPNGTVLTNSYNLNNQATSSAMGSSAMAYTYDPVGNLASTKKPEHTYAAGYTYDATGRLTATGQDISPAVGDALTAAQAYDAAGNPVLVTNPLAGTTVYTYDAAGRVTSQSTPSGGVVYYEYDKSGLLTSLTNARGYVRTFSYDAAERLIGFTDEEGDT
ncbi:MAG: DUF6531 domain-containing protein, partial [Coriobacteriales bacterium]|nr:DUF6531 domain-containing protein [Coriobacteriales bacterium]